MWSKGLHKDVPGLPFCFISSLLVMVEKAGLVIKLSAGGKSEGCCLQMILWGLVSLRNSYRGL